MDDSEILDRLTALGLELPDPPAAVASYLPCVVQGTTAYVAGQIAIVDGSVVNPGIVGDRDREHHDGAARRAPGSG